MNIIRADAPEERARGANAAELADAGLVGIQEVVRRPPMPTGPLLMAAAFLLLCVAIAFVGLGVSNAKPGDISPGLIKVAGFDPALGKVVPVDLKAPLVISGTLPSGAKAADHLRLSFSFGAVPIGHFDAAITPPGRQFNVAVDAAGYRDIVASDTTTNLSFEASGTVVAQRSFVLRTAQKWYLTLPGALAIALVLITVAYIESLLRALRRGRKQVTGVIGLALIGAVVGLVAVLWAWLLAAVMPTTATEIMCAILGAASGLAAGVAAQRLGRRRQLRPARRPARF
jgi:serine/threonine-protein kinase